MNKKILLVIQVLLVAILILYLPLRSVGAPIFLFWPIFISIVIVSLYIVLVCPRKYKIMSLIVMEICLSLILLVSTPNVFQMNRDTYFEAQYASTIIEQGGWDPTSGVGFAEDYYGYNPALHFILAFSSLTTGLTTYALSKYVFFVLLRIILVLSVLMVVSSFVSEKRERIVYLAMFFFMASYGMAFIEVSRRLIADIFFVLAVFALIKDLKSQNKVWDLLFYVFSTLIIIGNHSVAYLLLLFLFGMWLFGIVAKTRLFQRLMNVEDNYPRVFIKLLLYICIFLLWELFVANVLLEKDFAYVFEIISLVSGGFGLTSLLGSGTNQVTTFVYRTYETLTIYLYHFIFLLTSTAGLLLFVVKSRLQSNKGIKNNALLLYVGMFSIALFVPSFVLMRTGLDSAAYTFLWFFCIGMSIFIAYFMDEIYARKISKTVFITLLIVVSLLFYIGHMFSGIYTPRITNRALDENVVLGRDIRSQTPQVYHSAVWFDRNADRDGKIIGDINVLEIYSGIFEFDVSTDLYWLDVIYQKDALELSYLLIEDEVYFGAYEHTARFNPINYIVINDRFFKYPNDMFGEPVDEKQQENINKENLLVKIYDNKEISIYKNMALEDS